MKFEVVILPKVSKKSKKYLSKSQLEKLSEFFKTLEFDPLPVERYDVKPVKGKRSEIGKGKLYRFRIGDYRVFYTILWDRKAVVVVDIKPRERAYKK
ncbi:type II toxin-antitoxin system RelE family toxin [Thermococcus litoralis]|uniref:type II toxin-antitoxin system RelE family toxin n=1 Tax=Thermococcus litoralis TaxID=2265 RepID=UPI000B354F36|nr:type II toxin-antitoxin system RelE/ParE family toxin [Thermococcus litoralis]